MAKNSEYRMAIKIAGEIEKSLYTSTDMTRKELNKIAKEAAYASTKTKNTLGKGIRDAEPFFEGLEKTGVKAFKAIAVAAATAGTATLAIGVMAGKAGIEYESAFAGVKKTTDATAQEYEVMRQEILAMTREIPASANEIANVAEAAGQLGIKKDDLLEFSRTMIDLGESTNLSSTEAATSLAKFANITKMGTDSYGNLGSVIVDLGNNFATTEADIVEMGTRLAASGELAGFTEAQIMAMATSMSSVGIEAEAGGSAMSKLIKTVQVSVETGKDSLKDYAKVAGMTSADFKKAFEKDAVSAIASFISGLNDVERNGKSATVILEEMGLTETRLSNTITSLANADTLMYDAIETANEAWEENTALSIEAGKRYETTESKLTVMRQGFTEMGIEISDQFNGPLRDGIDTITDLIHAATDEIGSSNVINEIAQGIVDGVPTAIRVTKQFAEAVGDMAEPVIELGGWLVENPGVIEGTIVGIGTAIIGYKVVNNVSKLAAALKNLSGPGLAVMAITGAVSVIAGIGTAIKKSAEEAKKANLDKHFGNISLSVRDLKEAAEYVVSNDSMGKLKESIGALRELDGIDESINDTVSELNRMNWKISIGMKLKEDEQERYKQNIARYVEDVQSYIEQEQYAVNLAVGVLTDDDLAGSNIVTQLNDFYAGKNTELARLGTDLNKAVTDAFQDGLLDIPEAKTISDIQQQIAKVKAGLATGKYEAGLDLLGLKYSAGELNEESFQNLQAEVNEQMEQARLDYDEAYVTSNQSLKAMFADGKNADGKAYTQKEYEQDIRTLKEGYLEQVGSIEAKATSFMGNTIRQQYEPEIGQIIDNMPETLDRTKEEIANHGGLPNSTMEYEILKKEAGINSVSSGTKDALKDLWKEYKPRVEELQEIQQQYIEAGEEIPGYISDGINEGLAIGLLAKDKKILNEAFMQQIIDDNFKTNIEHEVSGAYDYLCAEIAKQAKKDINADVSIKFNIKTSKTGKPVGLYNNNFSAYAEGGIATSPEIALVAEAGYAESMIPIDGSKRSISLWQQTGEMLGAIPNKGGHSIISDFLNDSGSTSNTVNNSEENAKFSYSPTYQFYGEAPSGKELNEHVEASFEKWEEMMNRWMRNNKRFKFSS